MHSTDVDPHIIWILQGSVYDTKLGQGKIKEIYKLPYDAIHNFLPFIISFCLTKECSHMYLYATFSECTALTLWLFKADVHYKNYTWPQNKFCFVRIKYMISVSLILNVTLLEFKSICCRSSRANEMYICNYLATLTYANKFCTNLGTIPCVWILIQVVWITSLLGYFSITIHLFNEIYVINTSEE